MIHVQKPTAKPQVIRQLIVGFPRKPGAIVRPIGAKPGSCSLCRVPIWIRSQQLESRDSAAIFACQRCAAVGIKASIDAGNLVYGENVHQVKPPVHGEAGANSTSTEIPKSVYIEGTPGRESSGGADSNAVLLLVGTRVVRNCIPKKGYGIASCNRCKATVQISSNKINQYRSSKGESYIFCHECVLSVDFSVAAGIGIAITR